MSALGTLLRHRRALVALAILGGFLALALIGPELVGNPLEPVGRPLAPPSSAHWLGTTGQGQDVLWQTVVGARRTLLVGFGVGALVVAIGALLGTAAGYVGGRFDLIVDFLINVFLVIPGLPLMVAMGAYLPSGTATMALCLVVTGWAFAARVFRAQAAALRARDFVAAALVAGESHLRIVVAEILPNMTALCASSFFGAVLYAIAAQVGLEFIGIGDLAEPSWGQSLYWARNDAALLTGSWWTFVPAGACVGLCGVALVLLNGAVDEIANPRLRLPRAYLRAVGAQTPAAATPVRRGGHG